MSPNTRKLYVRETLITVKYALMNSYLYFSQRSDVKPEQRLIDVKRPFIRPQLTIFLKQHYVEIVGLCDLAPCYKTLYHQHESEAVSLRSESDAAIKIRKCSTIRVSEVGSREAVTHPGAGNMEWKGLFCEVERRMKHTRLLIHLFQ